MDQLNFNGHARAGHFGHRKLTPRACVVDSKKHLRSFLSDALEDLGFVTSECGQASDLAGVLDTEQPDLLVLSVCVDRIEIGEILETLSGKTSPARFSSSATRVDHGKSRPANWRGIRHCHAALAADAFQRREPA